MEGSVSVSEGFYLLGKKGVYQVEKFLGEGTFGKVAKCTNVKTNESLAIKIIKSEFKDESRDEIQALQAISKLDADRNNLVKFLDSFPYKSHTCVAFEILDLSLYDFMEQRRSLPLSVRDVRTIAAQLLVALDALKKISLVHGDIKPDNVMLVNHRSQPFRVKLIDFGLACRTSELWPGCRMQNLCYRAPEVILGLPLTESLDLWCLGYVLAQLYTGTLIHPWDSEFSIIRAMLELQGMPDSDLLDQGRYTRRFFSLVHHSSSSTWQLDTPERHEQKTGERLRKDPHIPYHNYNELLDDCCDRSLLPEAQQFIQLLTQMLEMDPRKRITPRDALRHQFFSVEQVPTIGAPSEPDPAETKEVEAKAEQQQQQQQEAAAAAGASVGTQEPVEPQDDMTEPAKYRNPTTPGGWSPVITLWDSNLRDDANVCKKEDAATTAAASDSHQDQDQQGEEQVQQDPLKTNKKSFRRFRKFLSRLWRLVTPTRN